MGLLGVVQDRRTEACYAFLFHNRGGASDDSVVDWTCVGGQS
jgi:hypothetical protein